jgi:prepilin-type processing-associated H-X9-DG protein
LSRINSGGLGSPFAVPLSVLACPSDNGIPSPGVVQDPHNGNYWSVTSYRFNYSGEIFDLITDDGVIQYNKSVQIMAITDGTSNTILFGEFYNFDPNWPQWVSFLASLDSAYQNKPYCLLAGQNWPDLLMGPGYGGYPLNNNNITLPLPPALDEVAVAKLAARGYCYGSGHPQGANFVFCDGSVHFISNAINNATTISSSYNGGSISLLGALCTRDGGEVVNAAPY